LEPGSLLDTVLPAPASVETNEGAFTVDSGVVIAAPAVLASRQLADVLSQVIVRATGLRPAIVASNAVPAAGAIVLEMTEPNAAGDEEAYDLTIAPERVTLRAATPAGLFYAAQTLRQLLPPAGEYQAVHFKEPRPALLPAARIADRPRFAWRGAMLDVARHFFLVDEVKRYIDLLALFKINRLHLHLSDDQGWRIEITSWPELARRGGMTQVGGGPGGYYTQQQYADLTAYAAERFITVVPEIDLPGHTNAAISAYGELNSTGEPAMPYTGIEVGFIALNVDSDTTDRFVDDVVRELAAITPGPYIHIGGDEVETLTPEQYQSFIARAQEIVSAQGKQVIGWDEIASAPLLPSTIVQYWRPHAPQQEVARAQQLILSPADRVYLDMKYGDETALGLNWAGNVSVRRAYDWDPSALIADAAESAVLGVEAPLWTETIATMRDAEFMAFPRLAAVADLAWSPASRHGWEAFTTRLAAQAPRWTALGVNFCRAPEIEWAGQ
jgi:hexosaminidase